MKKVKYIPVLHLILICSNINSQGIYREDYENKLITLDMSFKQIIQSKNLYDLSGLDYSLGLNWGKAFNKPLLISTYIGGGNYFGKPFTEEFRQSYIENFVPHVYNYDEDPEEEVAESFYAGMLRRSNIDHSGGALVYGVHLNFGKKYIPAIKIYGVKNSFAIRKDFDSPVGLYYSSSYGGAPGSVKKTKLVNYGFGTELIVFPGVMLSEKSNFHWGSFSLFFETFNMKNSKIKYSDEETNKFFLSEYVAQGFFDEFGMQIIIGFKTGINFY